MFCGEAAAAPVQQRTGRPNLFGLQRIQKEYGPFFGSGRAGSFKRAERLRTGRREPADGPDGQQRQNYAAFGGIYRACGLAYEAVLQTLPADYTLSDGTVQDRKRRPVQVMLKVMDSRGGKIGAGEGKLDLLVNDEAQTYGSAAPLQRAILSGSFPLRTIIFLPSPLCKATRCPSPCWP